MEFPSAELAKDALTIEGYDVLGAYMSPVSDHYSKKVPFFSLSQNHVMHVGLGNALAVMLPG